MVSIPGSTDSNTFFKDIKSYISLKCIKSECKVLNEARIISTLSSTEYLDIIFEVMG